MCACCYLTLRRAGFSRPCKVVPTGSRQTAGGRQGEARGASGGMLAGLHTNPAGFASVYLTIAGQAGIMQRRTFPS